MIAISVLLVASVTHAGAQTPEVDTNVPPFVAIAVAVVDTAATGGESAVILWGPHENGTDHMILLPEGRATVGELRKAAATLMAIIKSGSSFEAGTLLRAQPGSRDDGLNAAGRSLQWVPQVMKDLRGAEVRDLAGVGEVPVAFAVVEVK